MTHLTDRQLNDCVDERLPTSEKQAAERHIEECPACSGRLDDLRAMISAARAMPRSVDPDDDLWPRIRTAIDRGKIVELTPLRRRSVGWFQSRWSVAAAALALVMLSSAITALIVRGPADRPVEAGASLDVPSSIVTVVASYERSAARLRRAFEERRPSLPTATVNRIEHNLTTIDDAIAETMAMLRTDEDNELLIQLLNASYQQKVALLQLAAEAAL